MTVDQEISRAESILDSLDGRFPRLLARLEEWADRLEKWVKLQGALKDLPPYNIGAVQTSQGFLKDLRQAIDETKNGTIRA